MKISDFLIKEGILMPLASSDKSEVLAELVGVLPLENIRYLERDILKTVQEREKLSSTGIGNGIAIPHAKAPIHKPVAVSFGVSRTGVDFLSRDQQPVHLVFLVVSHLKARGPHIRLMARMISLLRNPEVRENLLLCKTPEEVIRTLER